MHHRHRIALVTAALAGVVSACIAGTDPDAMASLISQARQNAAEAEARVKSQGLSPRLIEMNRGPSATMLEVESEAASGPKMSIATSAKAGAQVLQASADSYILGGAPASLQIRVNGQFENKNGTQGFNTTVHGIGAARFYKAHASSCFENHRSAVSINAEYRGEIDTPALSGNWGPAVDEANKACSGETQCNEAQTRKSGRATFNSGVCDDDGPIYGSGDSGGETPDLPGGTPSLHCWWYRDVMAIFDPNTGKLVYAFWLSEWIHECDEMILSREAEKSPARVPVVLRARGPLGTTGRPILLIAESHDTVTVAIDTTRATAADLDAALIRAGSMWKRKDPSRPDGIVTTTLAATPVNQADDSRGAQLLRAVKARPSRHTPNRGRSRELVIAVARQP